MAGADQIKSLIKSFGEGDEARFFATAMQIAAKEARQGHSTFARELKSLIDKAKESRSRIEFKEQNVVQLSPLKRELRELIEVSDSKIKLVDMVLAKSVRKSLNRVVAEQKKFDELRKYGLSPRRKLLLEGPPGCGKTMTAYALAGELGLSVFVVRLDGLISKYMGETIAKLRMIFDAMASYRAVYLFDEFDSIGSNRNVSSDVGEIRRVLNSFLVNIEKDESNSLIIAATNVPDTLDPALFRRFDDVVRYPLPNQSEIQLLFDRQLHGFKICDDCNVDKLMKAAKGLSFAEIVQASEEAIKEMIIMEQDCVSNESIFEFLASRKRSN
jgi:SpoVK/Ycf46/Vps4 family AAA+-type ATPase